MGKTGLVWLVVCLLPAALAAGLYGLVGRRAAPVPHVFWRVMAYALAVVDLLLLAGVIVISVWIAVAAHKDLFSLAVAGTAIAALQLLVALCLLAFRQPRLLLGWCAGSLLGMACAVVILVSLGGLALKSGHGALVGALVLGATLPQLALSGGPLTVLPLLWIWQRWAAHHPAQ